jgi:hypothetical protein
MTPSSTFIVKKDAFSLSNILDKLLKVEVKQHDLSGFIRARQIK